MEATGELEIPVFAVASSKWTQEEFKMRASSSIRERKEVLEEPVDEDVLNKLLDKLFLVVGDYKDPLTFTKLREAITGFKLPVIYLAITPGMFTDVTQGLANVNLTASARVVVEKPFGRDLSSAIDLDESLKKLLPEDQIYRIDHYLGKESVEDLLAFRFANTLFEPVWNRNYISNIQITMSEDFGIEGRGNFYDEVGALRDVVQNHLLQVLSMLTMEPPIDMSSRALQDEKLKTLSSVRKQIPDDVIRGQYVGYLDETGVAKNSQTETFIAMKLYIDNWRWAGVPIYLRTGKKMAETTMEAVVEFKQPPRQLFSLNSSKLPDPNIVRFRMGRHDGVDLSLQAKSPGYALTTNTIDLTVEFAAALGERKEAYERLLDAAILGDHFRFTRIDAVLQSWAIFDDVLKAPSKLQPYFEGSWGPDEAQELVPGGWAICGKAADKSP